MRNGSGFDALVGQLTGSAREPSLPAIPDVLARDLLRSAERCWQALGRSGTREALNRLGKNVRRATVAQGVQPEASETALDARILWHGLDHLDIRQLLALLGVWNELQKLREFEAPGGPALYVAQSVAEAARSLQVKKGRHRPGKPPTPAGQKALVDAAVAADIRELNYLNSPNKPDLRRRICSRHGIGRDRFYAVLAAHTSTTSQ